MPSIPLNHFGLLKEKVLLYPRIAGTYLLEAADLPRGATNPADRDTFLRSFATSYGFSEPDVEDAEWKHAEVFRDDARRELLNALVGGAAIGHSQPDVPPAIADSLADEFLAPFGPDARFFCAVPLNGQAQCLAPYARPDFFDFIFGGGCIAVDSHLVAIFWMLDND